MSNLIMYLNITKLSKHSEYFEALGKYDKNKKVSDISVPMVTQHSIKNYNTHRYFTLKFLQKLQNKTYMEEKTWIRMGEHLLEFIPITLIIHLASFFLADSILDDMCALVGYSSTPLEIVHSFLHILGFEDKHSKTAIAVLKQRFPFFKNKSDNYILNFKNVTKSHFLEHKSFIVPSITQECGLCTFSNYIHPPMFSAVFVKTHCCLQTVHKCCIKYIYHLPKCPICSKTHVEVENHNGSFDYKSSGAFDYRFYISNKQFNNDEIYLKYGVSTWQYIQHP